MLTPSEPGLVLAVAFPPNSRTLITGTSGGAISFWSVPDLTREADPLPIGNGHNDAGTFGLYNPAGDVVGFATDPTRPHTGWERWFDIRPYPTSSPELHARSPASI